MKKLLLSFILLSTLSSVSNAESVNTCKELLSVYKVAYDARHHNTDYTDFIYALTVSYEGDTTGLYLIYQAARSAYKDIDNNINEVEGKKNFIKYCSGILPEINDLFPEENKLPSMKILT